MPLYFLCFFVLLSMVDQPCSTTTIVSSQVKSPPPPPLSLHVSVSNPRLSGLVFVHTVVQKEKRRTLTPTGNWFVENTTVKKIIDCKTWHVGRFLNRFLFHVINRLLLTGKDDSIIDDRIPTVLVPNDYLLHFLFIFVTLDFGKWRSKTRDPCWLSQFPWHKLLRRCEFSTNMSW